MRAATSAGLDTVGTALAVLNGLYVNAVQQTVNNGATTYTLAANQGTYLGSVYVNATAGQINCTVSWGQSRTWGLWNAYNRKLIAMTAGDSTANWSGASSFPNFSASNGSSANKITTFCGLAEEEIDATFQQTASAVTAGNVAFIGIGVNSTTTATGTVGQISSGTTNAKTGLRAEAIIPRGLGINAIQSLDSVTTAGSLFGTQANMVLTTRYWG